MVLTTYHLAADEACPFKHHEMFRDSVQRHRERPRNFGDGGRLPRHPSQNGTPGGVGDRREDGVQVSLIFNHPVEYPTWRNICQVGCVRRVRDLEVKVRLGLGLLEEVADVRQIPAHIRLQLVGMRIDL